MSGGGSILRRLGPGLITASVVLGPGSIVASSQAGASSGYALLWVIVVACILMAAYTSMAARLGCALNVTPLQYVAERVGRALAFLVGLAAFAVTAGFQFGNNLGVAAAMDVMTPLPIWIWPIVFTTGALLFLYGAKHLYRYLEKLMMGLVLLMIVAFCANLFWTGVSPFRIAWGLVPKITDDSQMLTGKAMLATTFSAVAALYQAYLVQAKQWRREDLKDAIRDAWLGIGILGTISAVILIGAAESLGDVRGGIVSAGRLVELLQGALGPAASVVFGLGLAAASFSSFIINALIGGSLMADGMGLNPRMDGACAKGLASVVMLIGSGIALVILVSSNLSNEFVTVSLLVAQSATLIAAPLAALVILVLTTRRKTMGELRNGVVSIGLGTVGLAVIVILAGIWVAQRVSEVW
jgi:Mn2+/Fe2+ NRAMP family transporter